MWLHCGSLQIQGVSLQAPKPGVGSEVGGSWLSSTCLSVPWLRVRETLGRPALHPPTFLRTWFCHQQLFLCGASRLHLAVKGLPLWYLGQMLPWPQEFFSEMSLWQSWGWLARQSHCPTSMLVDQVGQLKNSLKSPRACFYFFYCFWRDKYSKSLMPEKNLHKTGHTTCLLK